MHCLLGCLSPLLCSGVESRHICVQQPRFHADSISALQQPRRCRVPPPAAGLRSCLYLLCRLLSSPSRSSTFQQAGFRGSSWTRRHHCTVCTPGSLEGEGGSCSYFFKGCAGTRVPRFPAVMISGLLRSSCRCLLHFCSSFTEPNPVGYSPPDIYSDSTLLDEVTLGSSKISRELAGEICRVGSVTCPYPPRHSSFVAITSGEAAQALHFPVVSSGVFLSQSVQTAGRTKAAGEWAFFWCCHLTPAILPSVLWFPATLLCLCCLFCLSLETGFPQLSAVRSDTCLVDPVARGYCIQLVISATHGPLC